MFKSMLGCLFILLFGGILLFIGLIRLFSQMLFGKGPTRSSKGPFGTFGNFGGFGSNTQQNKGNNQQGQQQTHAGNAHHEGNPNSRQKRSGKIFEKNEGEYVDFEEIR